MTPTAWIAEALPWAMSLMTVIAIELQGRKWAHAWAFSLCGQVFWFAWIVLSQQWGFLPMAVVLTVLYARNHYRWHQQKPRQRFAAAGQGGRAWAACKGCPRWGVCQKLEVCYMDACTNGQPRP